MSKRIIHFKLPTNESGYCTIKSETIHKITSQIKRDLPRYYQVILTPFDIQISGNVVSITEEQTMKNIGLSDKVIEFLKKQGVEVKIIK